MGASTGRGQIPKWRRELQFRFVSSAFPSSVSPWGTGQRKDGGDLVMRADLVNQSPVIIRGDIA